MAKVEKKSWASPSISPDSAMPNYRCPLRNMGQVVDSWVRGGTRAVPSQCSGPPDSLVRVRDSNRAPMLSVPTSLTTWLATRAPMNKRSSYINTHITSNDPDTGIEPWTSPSNVWVLIHQTTPNTWHGQVQYSIATNPDALKGSRKLDQEGECPSPK